MVRMDIRRKPHALAFAAVGERVDILILDRGRGRTRAVRLRRGVVAGVLCAVAGSLLASALLSWRHFEGRLLDDETIGGWNARLASQREELESLSGRAQADVLTVGQKLAGMEARLLRMEALGQRVSEMATLTDGEFRFDAPAAIGGPVSQTAADSLISTDYLARIERLSRELRTREQEMGVLESLLASRRFQDEVAPSGRPVRRGWISSPYGRRVDPFNGRPAWHTGVDFAGKPGSDVIAVAGGVVAFTGERGGYGNLIEIQHGDGLATRYAHHEEALVRAGDVVKKGQVIARMGNTGRSTGHHVHFEVLKDGRLINPSRYIARRQ